jgi:hypothetical protein
MKPVKINQNPKLIAEALVRHFGPEVQNLPKTEKKQEQKGA